MTINSEQIQALKAAIDAIPVTEWIFCERQSLSHAGGGFVSINGVEAVWCLNKAVGGMAHSMDVLRYIAAANPSAILSLLAERDADKALIAEQAKRIAELEQKHCGGALMEREEHHVCVVNKLLERIAELEAIRAAAEKLVRCKGRYHSEQNYRALAALFYVSAPDLPPLDGEARTLTVKLPRDITHVTNKYFEEGRDAVIEAIESQLAAAGITLDVGE